jgi:long-chain acyl-CoA synthetase
MIAMPSSTYPSLCAMHRTTAERLGPRIALRSKHLGLYRNITWSQYRRTADRAAAGLVRLGVRPGDRIAILSENRWEWFAADHAILSAGAINVPLHAPLTAPQVQFQLHHSGACGVIVSGQGQADKVRQVLDTLPDLRFVVAFDDISPLAVRTLSWSGLVHSVRAEGGPPAAEPSIGPQDLASIIYTSGTTGNPKGVMLTHGNLLSNAVATAESFDLGSEDVLLSWLPYSHIYARLVDHYLTTLTGMTVVLGGPVDVLVDDLKAVQPTWMTSVPRFYEKVWTMVQDLSLEERRRKLGEIFGPRIRHLTSGGAPLPPHICKGFHEAGLPLLEGYGLTESSPVICFNRRDDWRIGTVGRAIPGVEVRIAEDGEVLTRGPHVMKGYWNNPQATTEAIDADGWLHTGDVGRLEDGFLSITDRKKDLIVLCNGKKVVPSEIERLLTSDGWIDQAVVCGDGRHFITALIVPNFARLSEHFPQLPPGGNGFIGDERVQAFYAPRIAALMEAVSQPERVKKFLVLGRPFRLDADELTATLKVRRRHIIAKYERELAGLYEEARTKS